MSITRLPAGAHRRMPWKNGAGSTSEVAISPPGAGMDEFVWRLAIADLDRSGPFSSFPGVDRLLMLLPPGGVTLTIDGERRAMEPGDVVEFGGESLVAATLTDGPVRDLNLMLRRGRARATMEAITLDGEMAVAVGEAQTLVCAIGGRITVELGEQVVTLEPLDCALVETGQRMLDATLRPEGERALLAMIAIRH
jgi:uncharacterized protein